MKHDEPVHSTLPMYQLLPPSTSRETLMGYHQVDQIEDDFERQELIKNNTNITLPIPKFVPSLEGFRGLSVLLVVFCHIQNISDPLGNNTGRSGVTMFFVLSGFLITGVLVNHIELQKTRKNSFSYGYLVRFYSDRCIRLYPALLVMVLSTGLQQLHVNGWNWPKGMLGNAFMALSYLGNFDYWGRHSRSIWKNTWSVAVEEQFYIFWSLLLPLLLATKPRTRICIIAVLTLASLVLRVLGLTGICSHPMWLFGYFSPIASFYKMLLGSLVRLSPSVDVSRKRYTAWVGFSILTLSLVACIPKTAYDLQQIGLDSQYFGYLIFIEPTACLSAVLIIVGSLDGNSFLESRFLRFIGRISYPLYLYQMPILHIKNWPRGWDAVSLSSLALVAATVSTLYLEEPLREAYRKWKTRKQDFV